MSYSARSSITPSRAHACQTEIVIDSNNNYYEVSTYPTAAAGPSTHIEVAGRQQLKKAEISLNDCLACR